MPVAPMIPSLVRPNDNDNTTDTSGLFITYNIVSPCLSAAGIFGNVLSLYVLSSVTKFKGFMFTYMKALAITDTFYLVSVLQVILLRQSSDLGGGLIIITS